MYSLAYNGRESGRLCVQVALGSRVPMVFRIVPKNDVCNVEYHSEFTSVSYHSYSVAFNWFPLGPNNTCRGYWTKTTMKFVGSDVHTSHFS